MTPSADQIVGSILGRAIGDAMGHAYEGKRSRIEPNDESAWALSDDTQLTLATCEAILECGRPDPGTIARAMTRWFREGRLSGLGSSTLKALRDLSAGAHGALAGRKGEMAAGNGAAMRIAPVAFLLDPQRDGDRQTIRDICRITLHNDEAYVGALAVVVAVRFALCDRGLDGLLEGVINALPDTGIRRRLDEILRSDAATISDVGQKFGNSGYVVDSVPLALYGASKLSYEGFRSVLVQLIDAGGDTDTIASIAGQVMGASVGGSGLDLDLVQKLPGQDLILPLAHRFAELYRLAFTATYTTAMQRSL